VKNNKRNPQSTTPTVQAATSKMPHPRNLTPGMCEKLKRDMLKACQKVAETHGLFVEGGELSDINLRHSFGIEFRVGIPMPDGTLYSAEKALFEVLAGHFGLKPSDYGRTFHSQGDLFRIVSINPNRPKYPISAERVADRRGFKFTAENVALYLQNSGNKNAL